MWYIIYNGQQVGPLSAEQLPNYNLTPRSMVWREGMPNWVAAGSVPELAWLLQSGGQKMPPPPYGQQQYYGGNYPVYSDKSKITTGILALVLGVIGVQYFYLGKTKGGLLTILLSVVTCGGWELITFIQGILILCMSDEEFYRKFVYTNKAMPLF